MKKLLIALAVVVLVIAAGAFLFVTGSGKPVEPVPSASSVEEEQAVVNTALYAALVSGGIDDPFVNVDENQAYAAYELPQGFDADVMQGFVIGAEAQAAPNSRNLVAVQYAGGTPKLLWSVATSDFDALVAGTLTDEQYEAKMTKKQL